MQFNSIPFLFCFLPIFLLVYYSGGGTFQAIWLIVSSLAFYALSSGGNYWWVALLVAVAAVSFLIQLLLVKKGKTCFFIAGLVLLTGILAFLKVYDGGILLPAGASFYLFQIAAVMIDVYREKIPPYKNILQYSRDIVMFPKLLSGPLVQPKDLQAMPQKVKPSAVMIRDGLHTLIIGLSLKVVLANNLGGLWAQPAVTGYEYISTAATWLAIIAYTMQLYLDFYGYSLMAIGIGKLLGFELPANFLEPYSAGSVSEFYRRWHATLGIWFKNYLYIPLGGNRKGNFRTVMNLAIVWLFTGLWHGVGGNYLLWAGFLCFLIINERFWLGKLLSKCKVINHVYVVLMIIISWIPFAVGNWDQMVIFCGRLVGLCGKALNPTEYLQWLKMYAWLLAGSVFMMTPVPGIIWKKIRRSVLADLLVVVLFWVVIYYLSTAAQNPFMYFRY